MAGMPKEEESDKTLPIWSGVVPVETKFTKPEIDLEHSADIELPDYLKSF